MLKDAERKNKSGCLGGFSNFCLQQFQRLADSLMTFVQRKMLSVHLPGQQPGFLTE